MQESSPGSGDFESNVLGWIDSYDATTSANGYYSYGNPYWSSFNGPAPACVNGESHLFRLNASDGLSMVEVYDSPKDVSGGSADMRCELAGDPDGTAFFVKDDPPEPYTEAGETVFTTDHGWAVCYTAGNCSMLMFWKVYKRLLKLVAKHIPSYRIRRILFKMAGYEIGKQVYIGEDLIIKDELADKGRVKIGNRVAIAERVTLIISSGANMSRIQQYIKHVHGYIEIDDDAWFGTECIIFPNVRIGKGAVVGAGAVVTKNVPDFTVVVGVPARPIKTINISQ